MYIKFGKRLFDIVISFVLLILLIPIFLVMCIIVWYEVGWPIIFRQKRLGIHGNKFGMIKLRTIQGSIHNYTLINEEVYDRTTSTCKWIRLHCCDEIVQLWNVLLGQMSMVGPRPLQQNDYDRLTTSKTVLKKLLKVRPGITGEGQIKMPKVDHLDNWTPKHDLHYVDNISCWNDIIILIKTIPAVIQGH